MRTTLAQLKAENAVLRAEMKRLRALLVNWYGMESTSTEVLVQPTPNTTR